jgi:hypothetical protein
MSKLSKKMYERCLNTDEKILRRMPDDVWEFLCRTDTRTQKLDACGVWKDVDCSTYLNPVMVYRIHPDTPYDGQSGSLVLTKEQFASMLECAKPLIKWINDNTDTMVHVSVNSDSVSLFQSIACNRTQEFVKD